MPQARHHRGRHPVCLTGHGKVDSEVDARNGARHEPERFTLMLKFDDALMLCPLCGGRSTHVDTVYMAGRPREDGEYVPVRVNSTGEVDRHLTMAFIPPPADGMDRRHHISLQGSCEICGGVFAITFTQHKGETYLSIDRSGWSPVAPAPT